MEKLLTVFQEMGISTRCFLPDEVEAVPDAKGAYALLMRLQTTVNIRLPRHPLSLKAGWLVYCGSAKGSGGLRARLRYHFRKKAAPHWHVDRLTMIAAGIAALPVCDGDECELVGRLLQCPSLVVAVSDFGNTDCTACDSHLLRYCG